MTTTKDLTPAHVDDLLKAARLDPQTVEHSHRVWQRHLDDLRSGAIAGWHGFDDIVTLDGLAGDYFWPEHLLHPAKMTFTFDPGMEGSRGRYRLATLLSIDEGAFYCVPNNPVIGWAIIGLAGSTPRSFVVDGMLTDGSWKVEALLLNKLGLTGPAKPPFAALRV